MNGLCNAPTVSSAPTITTAGGTATSSTNFTVTPTPYPAVQQGNKLVGTGNTGLAGQGSSVAVSAYGNTAIEGGSYDNSQLGAACIFVSQTCANPTNGGTIASSQTICQGATPSAFISIDPSGYTGILEYKWQYSVSPFTTWIDIANSNSNTYASWPLSVTTEFQRLARVICMSDLVSGSSIKYPDGNSYSKSGTNHYRANQFVCQFRLLQLYYRIRYDKLCLECFIRWHN